jgi:hypothetical protein
MASRDETTGGTTDGDLDETTVRGETIGRDLEETIAREEAAEDELAESITGGDRGPGLVDKIPIGGPPT